MKTLTLEKIRKQHALSLKKDEETEKQCQQLEEYLHQDKRYADKRISLFPWPGAWASRLISCLHY
ncbi:hypothetical protein [Paraflavitalea speifideaquila]|uniref:hypothetical protein n=1 Tax=Paraflavitalea speifideaquila TaxID=3076558 RepID=UPI0028E88FF7|nr:hypothetical protein [Paraflavitalea speifideiaquila]